MEVEKGNGISSEGIQERTPEGWQNEWKYAAAASGEWYGDPLEVPGAWDMRGSQNSVGMTLVEMPKSGEMKHVETISSCYKGPPVEGWGHQPTFKFFDLELFLF